MYISRRARPKTNITATFQTPCTFNEKTIDDITQK